MTTPATPAALTVAVLFFIWTDVRTVSPRASVKQTREKTGNDVTLRAGAVS